MNSLSSSGFRKFLSMGLVVLAILLAFAHSQGRTKTVPYDTLSSAQVKIVKAALQQIGKTLYYDPSYQGMDYPNGDVPMVKGVCTDVVIRSLRALNVDLQKLVHEHMKGNFSSYPRNWGLKTTDKNIDHRRVPNLQTFFKAKGWEVPNSTGSRDFQPGDIVSWKLMSGRDHIGVLGNQLNSKGHPLIIHNIGWGTKLDNDLMSWTITGHYRMPRK